MHCTKYSEYVVCKLQVPPVDKQEELGLFGSEDDDFPFPTRFEASDADATD